MMSKFAGCYRIYYTQYTHISGRHTFHLYMRKLKSVTPSSMIFIIHSYKDGVKCMHYFYNIASILFIYTMNALVFFVFSITVARKPNKCYTFCLHKWYRIRSTIIEDLHIAYYFQLDNFADSFNDNRVM